MRTQGLGKNHRGLTAVMENGGLFFIRQGKKGDKNLKVICLTNFQIKKLYEFAGEK